MELKEQEGWLFVRLLPEDRVPDLDWDRLVRWKIPEAERVHLPDQVTWIVRKVHRELIDRLFSVYRQIHESGEDLKQLQSVQEMIDEIERRYPNTDASQQAHFKAWLRDVGLN